MYIKSPSRYSVLEESTRVQHAITRRIVKHSLHLHILNLISYKKYAANPTATAPTPATLATAAFDVCCAAALVDEDAPVVLAVGFAELVPLIVDMAVGRFDSVTPALAHRVWMAGAISGAVSVWRHTACIPRITKQSRC